MRPLRRKGTSNVWFQKCIPADVRERMVGLSLVIPVGSERVPYRLTDKTTTLRFSLRTFEPSEVKVRHAEATTYFETIWASLRSSKPISLTHRQCVALSGDLYRGWVEEGRTRTVAVQFESYEPSAGFTVEEGGLIPAEVWQSLLDRLGPLDSEGEAEALEATFGPLVDRVLRSWGLGEVGPLKPCRSYKSSTGRSGAPSRSSVGRPKVTMRPTRGRTASLRSMRPS